MDVLTQQQRRKAMQHIRSKDTSIEVILRKALWHEGIRYRKSYGKLPGKPDIAITKYQIAVFCDGEFFHGKGWEKLQQRVLKGTNSTYWYGKIKRNIERDQEVNRTLHGEGWTVLRFWGDDIKKHTGECVKTWCDTRQGDSKK
jgi:DNA mismatch endonuclease (patch repair protein)